MFKSFTAGDRKLPLSLKRQAGDPDLPAPPPTVRRAVGLMYAGAATMTVFFVVALATMGSFKNAVIAASKTAKNPMTTSQINGYVTGYTLYVIFIGLISIGLWLWMARMNARGRGWARITATILLCLWTINTAGVVQTRVIESMVFPVIAWFIGAAAVFFLWRQESGAFFAATATARFGPRDNAAAADGRRGGSGGGGTGGRARGVQPPQRKGAAGRKGS